MSGDGVRGLNPNQYKVTATFRHKRTSEFGTHSPFAALHKFGSYRGFICRKVGIARPVSFDPTRTLSPLARVRWVAKLVASH